MAITEERSLLLLVCADAEKMIRFYTQAGGFTLARQIPNYAELSLGSFTLALTDARFMESFLGVSFTSSGTQRFVISLHSDALDTDVSRLVEHGGTIIMPPTDQPWGQRVSYIADPEGNLIELAQRRG